MLNEGAGGEVLPEQMRELQAALAPLAERHNLPAPRSDLGPEVYIGPGSDLREIAMKLGEICRDPSKGLFFSDPEIVTIDREKGSTEIMTPDRFRSWIADWALIGARYEKSTGRVEKCTLGCEMARGVLASDHFRRKIPRLAAVNVIKQPVKRRGGKVELLPVGYDAESQVYTLEGGLDYPEDMSIDDAIVFFRRLYTTFPWGDEGRSLGVHMAAGLTLYCQHLLPTGTLTPMFVYNANQGGSGKSLLATIWLWAMYGSAETMNLVEGHDEMKKELDTAAQAMTPYVFFDDQDGWLENRLLNSWLTSRVWAGRVLGTPRKFSMPKRAVTILTGNNVTLSPFLSRRSVLSDLFAKQQLVDRVLPADTIHMDDAWMAEEANRKAVLGALWALVRWSCVPREELVVVDGKEVSQVVQGRLLGDGKRARPTGKPLDSFETWSKIIPQIVVDGMFGDPLERPNLPDAGDKSGQEMRQLMRAVIKEHLWKEVPQMEPDGEGGFVASGEMVLVPIQAARVELSQMLRLARRLGLFSEILETTDLVLVDLQRGGKGKGFWREKYAEGLGWEERLPETDEERRAQAESWYDKSMANKLAARVKGVQAQYFTGDDGAVYQLGDRVAGRVSSFMIRRVS
jgi:hypothetical protein